MSRRRESGTTVVELAVAGAAVLLVLFACLEIARLMFVWNTIGEATRRGARLAAVCPPNHASVIAAAVLNPPGGDTRSGHVAGLETTNVSVQYLDAGGATTASIADMAFVRVSITGFQHILAIPFITQTINVPPFATTIPVESLGYVPETDSRQCAGG
ncbi:MAG: TadE family protein [Pseudomonadota bacterium]